MCSGNQIGMAPGARWIGCRNMDQGNGTPANYLECMEFFLAPYPLNGTPAQGDPDKAPDITTNSWGCPASEGCAPGTLQQAVEAQRAAGIMMVVAAGNAGPSCSTVDDTPGIYDAVYSVGAFDHRFSEAMLSEGLRRCHPQSGKTSSTKSLPTVAWMALISRLQWR